MRTSKSAGKNLTLIKSFTIAAHGFVQVFRNEGKVRLAFVVALIFISLAIWMKVSYIETLFILFAWIQVIVGEIFNTSIEKAIDYASNEKFHPLIKLGKDYAAASVFVLSVTASCISIFILGVNFLSK